MDYVALKAELTNDPLTVGYVGMSHEQAAVSLNGLTRPLSDGVPAEDVLRYLVEEGLWAKVEDLAATGLAGQKAAARALVAMSQVRLSTVRVAGARAEAMLDALIAGNAISAADKVAIKAMRLNKRSRAGELGIGIIKPGYVQRARAI